MARTTSLSPHCEDSQDVLARRLPERRYLPELHGVRGLALAGVVVFHLFGNGRVSGGIDIFLAVSGFLFTGMLLREAATHGGRIDPLRYYGRLARRILVPAALVIAVTLAVGLALFPVTRHSQLWAEARASLLYFENWELISSQLAYGAAGPETSPFQHFWSLSVQGQFYIVWPVLAMVAVFAARLVKTSAARVMAVLVGIVFIASFAYAIYVGSYNQDEAYLLTTTRVWQLAFGGLLALTAGSIRLPKPLRFPAGWIGLAMIVSCGIVLDGRQLFPGPWALWPLIGLTLVFIAAGQKGGNHDPVGSATHFLSNRALSWIGDHAYGLYLWHWPLIIFYLELRGRDSFGLRGAVIILAITVVLAMLTYRFIELPLKNRQQSRPQDTARRANKIVVSAAAAALAVAGTGATLVLHEERSRPATDFVDWDWDHYPGALITTPEYADTPEAANYLPAVEDLQRELADIYRTGCVTAMANGPGLDKVKVCEDPDAPEDPTARIVISGGSHSAHWYEAYKTLGAIYGWEVLVVNKDACVFSISDSEGTKDCQAWIGNYIEWLEENDVDLVVTAGTRILAASDEQIEDGAIERWQQITDTGTDLVLMRGTPRPGEMVNDCLASGNTPEECGASSAHIADTNPLSGLDLPDGVYTVDVTDSVCPDGRNGADTCTAVVGNVVVWYDGSHLTNTFARTLAPLIEEQLKQQAAWLFE
ncbi:acyltransferase family protein [Flaviflexus ciconiae]|uniref:acyltransferase family protein n=1 Tax=Flaviflexus ciconiae TaxID=2496867 RepID=UPI0013DF6F61|nr:acyltransferase family protein [Flaviflexus ciconiae]